MAKIYSRVLRDVSRELDGAIRKYPRFHSGHEGYAVLLEEVRELEREVFRSPKKRKEEKIRAEALQVAAMAIRFVVDVSDR